eukprot:CAMPEP_0119155608 /NCGR_PEP_ID=MMETSP1310-20130426/51832_1 /TAXON_ID=464262 /ORGANISM="Genus nov. species nov., Strain RCC2339" /LENGTH=337 /DNA_ID=CAMNT_0007148207 /DNA_START=116 /DNA_END=1129 /DNA_ORIENTATION=+
MACIRSIRRNPWVLSAVAGAAAITYIGVKPYTDEKNYAATEVVLPSEVGEDFQVNARGLLLYTRTWKPVIPDGGTFRGIMFICHGYGEHINRYTEMGERFAKEGFAVYGMDHQGYGYSQGVRAYVQKFDDYIDDFNSFVDSVLLRHPENTPRFVFGHSMGALISLTAALERPEFWDGIILASGCFQLPADVAPPSLRSVASFLSSLFPKGSLPYATTNVDYICRDKEVVERAIADPLYNMRPIPFRTAAEMMEAMDRIPEKLEELSTFSKTLVLHGTADKITMAEGSKMIHGALPAKCEKSLIMYDDFYHELIHDPGKEQPYQDMVEWLTSFQTVAE